MSIDSKLLEHYPKLNQAQQSIISHLEGPLLVIAGPGSGKTFSLVLRALNLLLLGKAAPEELILCTFTEKAAFELRDRIASSARMVGYPGDLSGLTISTIHGLCNRLLTIHRHRTPLGNNYETLDDLTQLLFIFDHFDEIIGPETEGGYLTRWQTRWTAIEGARGYFDKITEELIDLRQLVNSADPFLQRIGQAYLAYRNSLFENNRLDFAHQQKLVHALLLDPETSEAITRRIKYVMVDEYQDTNHLQEQILLRLTRSTGNLCVVGDEDQSLYRFRGATVRNILEFPDRLPETRIIKLTTNYRSHQKIIAAYDRWMASADWTNPQGRAFRYDKSILPDPDGDFPEYPAIFCIRGVNKSDEAGRLADLVDFLKKQEVISDYSQVALLLHSVRQEHSQSYLAALDKKAIPAFCPRARGFFDNEEIRLMVGCLALIFGYFGDGRGELQGGALMDLVRYVDASLVELARRFEVNHPLPKALRTFHQEIQDLQEGQSLDLRPADYFYRLIAIDPFPTLVKNENRARNLAIFSQLLNTFQHYYHYNIITYANRRIIRLHFFNSFLRLLHDGGINEYEDPDQPIPQGYVQVMTIHQAKGLEFPVVIVGSLDKKLSSPKRIDRDLQPFYQRLPFEPENRITAFDRMRLHYVAFSRPEKILVLTAASQPKDYFASIWQGLPQWPYVQQDLLAAQNFALKDRIPIKKTFSFTGDLKVYETCPRQYQFFREYDFTPSRSATIFFGLLVHQTIEEIHRLVLDGKFHTLNPDRIRNLFDQTYRFLTLSDVRPIAGAAKEGAYRQVLDYYHQNQEEMQRVIETEVDVSVEKDGYILTGKVDLLLGGDGKLELLDFKTMPKPTHSPELLLTFDRQLCTYAHILESRYGKRPDRLLVYWTAEPEKKEALMEFPYRPESFDEAGRYFDTVVGKIQSRDFSVPTAPASQVCKECDMKFFCGTEGLIQR